MTKQELIAAVEATGATDVKVEHAMFDGHTKVGVALQFHRDGTRIRNAVRMGGKNPPAAAYPSLLNWARKVATK